MSDARVLIVDDDPALRKVLSMLLGQAGIASRDVGSGAEALAALEKEPFEVVISDVRMEGIDGMELLDRIGASWPGLPVVMLTAHGSIPLAVRAMQSGAHDFVLKPFDREQLVYVVQKALAIASPVAKRAPEPRRATSALRGESDPMRALEATIARVAVTSATVLLRGETGVGKELVARAIHDASLRRAKPLVPLHCAALPDSLLESEIFGHEKGAFTGAIARKAGRIELANGGTLFLDEIGELSAATQAKLLRVLQERTFERVGGTETIKVDVRFIAATHRDLEAMVARGEFREDLYFRLNVVPLRIPPLRERRADIEPLAAHFCVEHAKANGKPSMTIAPRAFDRLRAHAWPGNVRELQNMVERLVVLADARVITEEDVDRELARDMRGFTPPSIPPSASPDRTTDPTLDARRSDAERDAIASALDRAKGNRTVAARLLGVSRRTLYNKLSEHGIA